VKLLTYLVSFERTPGSDWGASVPDLPGCVAVAKTVDAALRRIHIAIEMHLQGMREDGQRPPRPKQRSVRPRSGKSGCEFFATVQVTE
jgi:predicted RNase H-like HicB family nuclease